MERFPLCCDPFVYRIDVLYYRRSVGCRLRNSHHRIPSELKRRPCAVPGYISAPLPIELVTRARAETFLHDRLVTLWMATWHRPTRRTACHPPGTPCSTRMSSPTCNAASSSFGPLSNTQFPHSCAALESSPTDKLASAFLVLLHYCRRDGRGASARN